MARPIVQKLATQKGEEMTKAKTKESLDPGIDVDDDGEKKPAIPPRQNPNNIRVCGKWRPAGYKPSKAEREAWLVKCKRHDLDPRTGRVKPKKD